MTSLLLSVDFVADCVKRRRETKENNVPSVYRFMPYVKSSIEVASHPQYVSVGTQAEI